MTNSIELETNDSKFVSWALKITDENAFLKRNAIKSYETENYIWYLLTKILLHTAK